MGLSQPTENRPASSRKQVGTDTFIDCDGRSVSVDDLAIPSEVRPVVVDRVATRN